MGRTYHVIHLQITGHIFQQHTLELELVLSLGGNVIEWLLQNDLDPVASVGTDEPLARLDDVSMWGVGLDLECRVQIKLVNDMEDACDDPVGWRCGD